MSAIQMAAGAKPLTNWIRFYDIHISKSNKGEEVHNHSQTEWDFQAGMLVIQIEARSCIATYSLDGISWHTYQTFKLRVKGA